MPNRLIREGFLDSEAINSLDHFTECIYHRLLIVSDDAGRFDGRANIIASRCYPLRDNVRAKDVEKHLLKLVEAGLIIRYQWSGKPFLQLTKWQKCGKAVTSKYPWVDGKFKIKYASVDTRDGIKDFIITSIPDKNPITTPSLPHADGVKKENFESNTETETNTNTETRDGETGEARGSLSEVIDYAKSRGLPASDGEHFFNSMEAGGWTRNSKKIKNWQACFRTWQSGGYLPSQKQNRFTKPATPYTGPPKPKKLDLPEPPGWKDRAPSHIAERGWQYLCINDHDLAKRLHAGESIEIPEDVDLKTLITGGA